MEAYCTECKLPVLNLLKSPIISIFALQGRHVAPIPCEIWHDREARWTAWPSEISPQSVHGGGYRAPKVKNFYFLVKIRESFDQFL